MPLLFDASNNPVPSASEQWRAAALLAWLTDRRISQIILRRGTSSRTLDAHVTRLKRSTVEWEPDPTTGIPRVKKDAETGKPISRLLSEQELLVVKRQMLLMLQNRHVRQAIALHDAHVEHERRAREFMDDESGAVPPPPKLKVVIHQVRELLQTWRLELEAEEESRKLIVRPVGL